MAYILDIIAYGPGHSSQKARLNETYIETIARPRLEAAANGVTLAEHKAGQAGLFAPNAPEAP